MEELNWRQSPFTSVMLTIVIALGGFLFIGPFIGLMLAMPFVEESFADFLQNMSSPVGHPELKTPYFIVQGCATFFGLIIIPTLYVVFIEKLNPMIFFRKHRTTFLTFLVIVGIVIFFIGFNSIIIEWNANIDLPDSMQGFENWARRNEDMAMEVTKFLTVFDTPAEFIVGLLVIAVFAGIGEELVFRGLLQPALYRLTKNIHVAIWVSAILFSTLHMQFFGFVPRVLLGALFGYLYYWSGNLAVPMFAHFVNNALSVIAMYALQKGVIDMDVDSTEAHSWPIVITFTLCAVALLYYFKKQFDIKTTPAA